MKNLLLFFGILITTFAQAQNSVTGAITSQEGENLEFVNVLLMSSADSTLHKGTFTDTAGVFLFEDIENGDFYLVASMVGFGEANTETFSLTGSTAHNTQAIALTSGVNLDEVTVTATKPFIELRADKIVVNVSNSSVAAGNNALEVLQKSPGVVIDKDNNIALKGKQGVLVTINGKQQYMSNQDIARLLESTPSSVIESIEIIQNPSAKYDAEGNSGIINIVMKKNENLGSNGSVTLSGRQGRKSNFNGSLMLNYRSDKVNVYGDYSNSHWAGFNDLNLVRDIPFQDGSTLFTQESEMNFSGISHNAKVGVDFTLTDKTTLGVLAKTNIGDRDFSNDNMTMISGSNAPAFSQLGVISGEDNNWSNTSFNINLKQDLNDKGSAISFDADYSIYGNDGLANYTNSYMDDNGVELRSPGLLKNDTETTIDIFATTIDYNTTVGKYNVELGGKFSSVKTDNATIFEDQIDGAWIVNADRSNQFVYEENVIAAYANTSTQIGKFMVQAGLRLEKTNSDGNSVTLNERVERNYTDLFPSLSLSHTIAEKHSLSYTYSRRLNRPNYQNLNPFIEYLDDFTFQKGNPFLRPQYAQSFGLNYGLGRSLFVSLNYSKTTEAMTQVIEQFSDMNTTFQTTQNLDDYVNYSANVTAPIVLGQKWTTRLSLTGFYNKFSSVIPSGTLDNSQFSYNLYMGNEISVGKGWRGEISGYYQSKLVWGLFEVQPQYSIDLGISKRIMDGNGSIKFGVNDIFRTQVGNVDVMQDDIDLQVNEFRDSRRASVSFTYNFGNKKVKQARRRKSATADESSRISNDN